jgi:competence protein ComEA
MKSQWKKLVNDYFTFSKKDRNAALVLMILIIIVFFLPYFFSKPKSIIKENVQLTKQVEEILDKKQTQTNSQNQSENFQPYQPTKSVFYNSNKTILFNFDPNTISKEDWLKLGVKEKTVNTIQKLLAKGFQFRKPEDIKKVFGISPQKAAELIPYIQIKQNFVSDFKNTNEQKTIVKLPYTKTIVKFDINNSDTSDWIQLNGIGSKLAKRIITFREKLGGFISIKQVAETYGLPDTTFQKIKEYLLLNNTHVQKININQTTVDELKNHPYIKWNVANAIIQFKNQHGNYTSVNDLKKIRIISDSIFQKISPYLSY